MPRSDPWSESKGLAMAILRGESAKALRHRAQETLDAIRDREQRSGRVMEVTTLLGSRTAEPMVQVEWGSQIGQLTPESAREHAVQLIESAESAIGESLLWRLLEERLGLETEMCAAVMADFRKFRQDREETPGD